MLTKLKGYETVSRAVDGFIHNTHDFDQDPNKLYGVRDWMGEELNKASK